MKIRRSVVHWIGARNLPTRLSEAQLQETVTEVRNGNTKAAEKLILSHVRLGMAKVAEFAMTYPNKVEELVSEMLWGLVRGTELISEGKLTHDNVTAYLIANVVGRLKKVVTRDYLLRGLKRVQLKERPAKSNSTGDIQELIRKSIQTAQEQIVIDLRVEGLNDTEIGERLNLTKGRVHQIRTQVKERLKELLDGKGD